MRQAQVQWSPASFFLLCALNPGFESFLRLLSFRIWQVGKLIAVQSTDSLFHG